jgi:hypothetical protein
MTRRFPHIVTQSNPPAILAPSGAAALGAARRFWRRVRPVPPGAAEHVALGTFCHVAAALRESGLRRWTGPFDWIFSTPAMIAACIEEDFATFLDAGNLRSVPEAELTNGARKQCRHVLFESRYGLPAIFNHHDPAARVEDAEALRRSADRMRKALGGAGRNVLYLMSEVTWPEDEMTGLQAALGRLPSRNVLVVLTVSGGAVRQSWGITSDAEAHGCRRVDVRIETLSASTGVRFADPADGPFLESVLRALSAHCDPALRARV